MAKQALKKLPQQALTKTFYYPIIKSIAKTFGAKMTKDIFAKGVSKAVPIIGGVVSGGITLATMIPMGNRLIDTLDEAHFSYSESNFEADWKDIMTQCENIRREESDIIEIEDVEISTITENVTDEFEKDEFEKDFDTVMRKISQAKQMCDDGIISEDEFGAIKAKLISQL